MKRTAFSFVHYSTYHPLGLPVHVRVDVPGVHAARLQRLLPHDARRPLRRHDGLQPQEGRIAKGQQPGKKIHRYFNLGNFVKSLIYCPYIKLLLQGET